MYKFGNGKMIKLSISENEESCKKINPIYDENGFLLADKRDICDCTTADCPGCFFPCEKCGSSKCGHMCRVNRSWSYKIRENVLITSTSSNPNNNIVEIIDMETDDNLVKQKSENLKPVGQPINDFENMDVKLECKRNADVKIENVEKINLKISEMQNNQIKSVDSVQNNLVLNNIENKEEIINVNVELLNEKEELIVVQKNADEMIITEEKQPMKIVEENDKKNLQQTDYEKIEKVIEINHEKQILDKKPMKELKNANIEQTVFLPQTNNEELITNELKELQDTEILQQTENTENISIQKNKKQISDKKPIKELKNANIEQTVLLPPTNNEELITNELKESRDIELLQQTENTENISIRKQTLDKEPRKELKNANIEQTVFLPPTNNEELITNEPKESQDIELLQQTENTENISIKDNKLAQSEGFKNTCIETPIFHKQTKNLENNSDSKKYVNKLIDSEKNKQIKTTKIDIENKLTDLKQIENETIEKTTSHDKQINTECVENVVNDKLMEIEEIRSENAEEAIKQTVNTENTSVEINPLTEQKEFRDTINVGMDINQLIELEEIKSKDADESIMEPKYIKNIEEFKVKDDEL